MNGSGPIAGSSYGAFRALTDASRIWRVYVLVAGVGLLAALTATVVAVTRADFSDVSPAVLADACRAWALTDATADSVLVLALGSLGIAVSLITGRVAVRQLVAGRRFERRLPVVAPLAGVARGCVIDVEQPQAFCVGLLRAHLPLAWGDAALESRGARCGDRS